MKPAFIYLRRLLLLLPTTLFLFLSAFAGEEYHAVREFPMSGGLTQEHFSDFVQDEKGYVYIGTWDGIVRYDGYRFDTFRPETDDVSTCRVAKMRIDGTGNIYCEMYNGSAYVFDTSKCQFKSSKSDVPDGWTESRDFTKMQRISPDNKLKTIYPQGEIYIKDRQGNIWIRGSRTLAIANVYEKDYVGLTPGADLFIRSVYQSADSMIWQGSKGGHLLCGDMYVTPAGTLTAIRTQFSHKGIYSLYEDSAGRMLVGTRGDGLYRLTPRKGHFGVEHWKESDKETVAQDSAFKTPRNSISGNGIYDITSDGNDGYHLATWGGGINHFANGTFSSSGAAKLRGIIRLDSMLIAASTDGLLIYSGGKCFQLLNGCDITAVAAHDSRVYFVVYGRGLFSIPFSELPTDNPVIDPFPAKGNSLPKVITAAIVENDRLWLFSTSAIVRVSLSDSTSVVRYQPSSTHILHISETKPTLLADGRILMGTEQGSIILETSDSAAAKSMLPVIVTGVQHQGDDYVTPLHDADTLTIEPHERSFALFLSTLDFKEAHKTRFIYKLEDTDEKWNYSSQGNSIDFNGLQPGVCRLHIRAMSVEDNSLVSDRIVVIDVLPRFHETLLFKFFVTFILLFVIAASLYTISYIRRMHARQRALEEYCHTLLTATPASDHPEETTHQRETQTQQADRTEQKDKQILDRFMEVFNSYMADNSKSLDDYAAAMNMSYSSLYRKIKSLVGCSPIEFINRLRIQVATDLFDMGEQQIADVAYRVGFSDPKYFSKCFKAKTGLTPSKYIENKMK